MSGFSDEGEDGKPKTPLPPEEKKPEPRSRAERDQRGVRWLQATEPTRLHRLVMQSASAAIKSSSADANPFQMYVHI